MRHILHNDHSMGSVINVNDHIHGNSYEINRFINESCKFMSQ